MIKEIWLVFTVMFIILAGVHTYRATRTIKKMQKIKGVKSINGLTTGLVEFQEGLDEYVDQLNRDNKLINTVTAVGYLITAGTAAFSYYIV